MIVGHSDRWATTRCGSAVAWLVSKTLIGEYLVRRTFEDDNRHFIVRNYLRKRLPVRSFVRWPYPCRARTRTVYVRSIRASTLG